METQESMTDAPESARRPRIVCAARGGKGSQPAVTRAIRLAKEQDADLTFLFVVDAEFLSHATIGPPSVIHQQLHDMGEFIMMTLEDKAKDSGVIADHAVREGEVQEQIRQYVQEHAVEYLVMGRPVEETDAARFDSGTVSNFAAALQAESGVEVVLVGQDDVLGEEQIGS